MRRPIISPAVDHKIKLASQATNAVPARIPVPETKREEVLPIRGRPMMRMSIHYMATTRPGEITSATTYSYGLVPAIITKENTPNLRPAELSETKTWNNWLVYKATRPGRMNAR